MLAALFAISVHLIAPSDGATLRGGHFATLTWSAEQLPRGAEEWEAFLSVDGGRYYAVRLTPHLDIAVRTFQVLIPNIDSDDARLLIRTGDERNETIVEMPQRMRIRAEASFVRSRNVGGHGESARPNEPPVVMWSVGDHVVGSTPPATLHAIAIDAVSSHDVAPTTTRVRRETGEQAILPVRADKIVCAPRIAENVLLRTSRMNV